MVELMKEFDGEIYRHRAHLDSREGAMAWARRAREQSTRTVRNTAVVERGDNGYDVYVRREYRTGGIS